MSHDRWPPRRGVFLSHTAELTTSWGGGQPSYVDSAFSAVSRAGDAVLDMRHFPSGDYAPLEESLDQVRRADVYVLIAGFLYGSPTPEDPERSYVESEFEEAGRRGIPRFPFLISEYAQGMPIHTRDNAFGDRQERFRKQVRACRLVVKEVLNPWQFELELFHSLTRLREPPEDSPDAEIGAACRALAGVAPADAGEALAMLRTGDVQETLRVLGTVIKRLRTFYPSGEEADWRSAEISAELQATRQASDCALANIAAHCVERVRRAVENVVHDAVDEVEALVERIEPTTQLSLFPRPAQVERLQREVAERAVAEVSGRLQRRFLDAVEPILAEGVRALWESAADHGRRLQDELDAALPGAVLPQPAMSDPDVRVTRPELHSADGPYGVDQGGAFHSSVLAGASAVVVLDLATMLTETILKGLLGAVAAGSIARSARTRVLEQTRARVTEHIREQLAYGRLRSWTRAATDEALDWFDRATNDARAAVASAIPVSASEGVGDLLNGKIAVRRALLDEAAEALDAIR